MDVTLVAGLAFVDGESAVRTLRLTLTAAGRLVVTGEETGREAPAYKFAREMDAKSGRRYGYIGFESAPDSPPTEAQRRTMAGLYLDAGRLVNSLLRVDDLGALAAADLYDPRRDGYGFGSDDGKYSLRGPGNEACNWAFAGMSPAQVSERYGDGRPVYLAGAD